MAENGVNSGEADDQDTNMQVGGGEDEADNDDRKLFVGGLHNETSADDLQKYMETYGEVTQCTLKTDFDTHRSRCFGFVVFKESDAIDKCLSEETHMLQGKKIDPKKAHPRGQDQAEKVSKKKIFVGKVDPSTSEEAIREYFGTFGKIEKVEMPYDKMKDERKNYVFIEFENEEPCGQILEMTSHKIGEMEVDVKKPTNTPHRGRGRGFGFRGGDRGGRGGRGGGWGNNGGNWQGQGGGQGYGNYNYQDYYGNYYSNYGGYDPNYYNNYWGGGGGGGGGYDQSYYGGYGGQGGYNYGGGWGGYDQSGYNNYWGGDEQSGGYGKTQKGGRGGGQGYRSSPY